MKTKSEKLYWKCHTENLFKEILINSQVAALERPINILGKILFALADRAREINDPELNSLCCRLTLFAQADPQSPDYDKRTSTLIQKWDKKLVDRLNRK